MIDNTRKRSSHNMMTIKNNNIKSSSTLKQQSPIQYRGSSFFRQRIILSILTGRSVHISNIRCSNITTKSSINTASGWCSSDNIITNNTDDLNNNNILSEKLNTLGLADYEASLLRLIDKITDGSSIEIDESGTDLIYHPGVIIGTSPEKTETIFHNCGKERNVTYYLEALLLLSPFSKHPLDITLRGCITADSVDISISTFRTVTLPLAQKLLNASFISSLPSIAIKKNKDDYIKIKNNNDYNYQLNIIKHGIQPENCGEVRFFAPIIRAKIEPFQWLFEGQVKRIRGVITTINTSQQLALRIIDKTRLLFNKFLSDVWIYIDNNKNQKINNNNIISHGYSLSLISETKNGFFKAADGTISSLSKSIKKNSSNDDMSNTIIDGLNEFELLGSNVATRLLTEIYQGGVVDSTHQYLPILFMALADEYGISQVTLSSLTPSTIALLRHIRDFLGVSFIITPYYDEWMSEDDNDGCGTNDDGKNTDIQNDKKKIRRRKKVSSIHYTCNDNNLSDINSSAQFLFTPVVVTLQCIGIGKQNTNRKTF